MGFIKGLGLRKIQGGTVKKNHPVQQVTTMQETQVNEQEHAQIIQNLA